MGISNTFKHYIGLEKSHLFGSVISALMPIWLNLLRQELLPWYIDHCGSKASEPGTTLD